ncbi:MAG: T9SS type A sorting domain-containing protein [Bacteroidetes bacterium]|nr:T9SS type A sorting domain-containing protein [Bacteroidota bacterium]
MKKNYHESKKTILAGMLAIASFSCTTKLNAQAAVNWRTELSNHPFSAFGEGDASSTEAFIDTVSNRIYRFNNDMFEEKGTYDYDPGTTKANKTGDVIACYDAATGKYLWANEIQHISTSGYVSLEAITTIGNKKGLFVAGSFTGKMKYGTTIFNSTNIPSTNNTFPSKDLFIFKLDENGKLLKSIIIKPIQQGGSSGGYVRAITTDVNGAVCVAFENYSGSLETYDVNPGTGINKAIINEGDVIIAKYDINLNYLNHNVISTFGNNIDVRTIVFDAGKNLVVNAVFAAYNNNGTDLDTKQAGKQSIVYTLANSGYSERQILIKYNSNLGLAWHKTFDQSLYSLKMNVDGTGAIYLGGVLTSGDIFTLSSTQKLKGPKDSARIFVAKYDKLGNYKSCFSETRKDRAYVDQYDFSIDSKNNIYFAGSLDYSVYMFKLKTASATNSFSQVWKNRIQNTNAIAENYLFGLTVLPVKNSVFLFGAIEGVATYKDLVNNPMSKFTVQSGHSEIAIKYTLSGAALSAEEQVEENSNISYKLSNNVSSINLSIYPNPATDVLTVKSTLSEIAVITIYNYNGVAVKTAQATEQETKLNISELPGGMYFVEVVGNDYKEIRKIIKQ